MDLMKNDIRLNRRQFLRTSAAVAGFAGLSEGFIQSLAAETSNPAGPASVGTTVRFAPQLAVFSKIYQELHLDFEESAQVTAEARLDGVDCTVRDGGEIAPERAAADMPRYAQALQKHGKAMLLLTTGIIGVTTPHARDILRTAKKLGIRYYRLGYWPHQPGIAPEKLQKFIKAQLKELAALNRELGVCALFQNHSASKGKYGGAAGSDLAELYEIVKDFDPQQIGVAFDLGHAIITHGDEWVPFFDKLKPHIQVAYIKDVQRPARFVHFGQGEFARTDIFRRLKAMNYQAPLSIHIEFDWTDGGKRKTKEALIEALAETGRVVREWVAGA